MPKSNSHEWADTISKILLPVVIFVTGLYITHQKDLNDRANQQFERDSGILKLAASTNEKERQVATKMIEVELQNKTFTGYLMPVVAVLAQGVPSDDSTIAAKGIQASVAKQNPETGAQSPAPNPGHQLVYIQIAREDQRQEAASLQAKFQEAGFSVPGIQLVSNPTITNSVRYFSSGDSGLGDKVVDLMKESNFIASSQNFSSLNHGGIAHGTIEVWLGTKQP